MKFAIIGGSGFENPDLLKDQHEVKVETPYGAPSSTFKTGKIGEVEVAVLSRHDRNQSIPPTQVNNRANIWAICASDRSRAGAPPSTATLTVTPRRLSR